MIQKLIEMYRAKSDEELQNILRVGLDSYHPDAIKAAETVLEERGIQVIYGAATASSASAQGRVNPGGVRAPQAGPKKKKSNLPVILLVGGLLGLILMVGVFAGKGGSSSGGGEEGLSDTKMHRGVEIYNLGNDQDEQLAINGDTLTIPANTIKYYKLNYGKNDVAFADTSFTISTSSNTILNPGQLPFYFEEVVYAEDHVNEDNIKYLKYPFNFFTIDGAIVMGPYKEDTSYALSGYQYGPGRPYPENVRINSNSITGTTHRYKLYTKDEFVKKQEKENPFFQEIKDLKILGINGEAKGGGVTAFDDFRKNNISYKSTKKQKATKGQLAIVEMNEAGKKAFVIARDDGYQALINSEGAFFDPENGNGTALYTGYRGSELLGYGSTIRKWFEKVNSFKAPEENHTAFHLQTGEGKYSVHLPNNKLHQIEFEEVKEKKFASLFKIAINMASELQEERVDYAAKAKRSEGEVVEEEQVVEEPKVVH